ncbi:MAG: flagellar export chaperone FlgN [Lachnospiraceae bacterium]|jgi:flagellar biosynthesis/type III secretory pathway chaperone|nr:flagellar export chaperone FlgN [Lachnospiraceae bacterium]
MIELQILTDSLNKKKDILTKIVEENKNQENALKIEPVSLDDFDAIVDKKAALLDELGVLDSGFESVYDRIREQLVAEQSEHKAQISTMKALISAITELSITIQAQEERNKTLVEKFFSQSRKDLQADRLRSKASYDYMNRRNSGEVAPRFLDTKS